MPMRPMPWWGVLSASCAPVLLIGGWTVAASRQPPGYDPVVDTISALAARGAGDRWVMTGALEGLGVCHMVTALGLRAAAAPGRLVLAGGGVATLLVAVFPQPGAGTSPQHAVAAGVAFTALAVWPTLAARRAMDTPVGLRPVVAGVASGLLAGAVVWFAVELNGGTRVGFAERVAAGAQALWPLFVAVSASRLAKPTDRPGRERYRLPRRNIRLR